MKRWLRHRIAWILPTYTDGGTRIPPLLGAQSIIVALFLPFTFWFGRWPGTYPLFIWNLLLLGVVVSDDIFARRYFQLGMMAGRVELTEELLQAGRDFSMDPLEYLDREIHLGHHALDD